MATRYCDRCNKDRECREERKKTGWGKFIRWVIRLFCPVCGALLDIVEE